MPYRKQENGWLKHLLLLKQAIRYYEQAKLSISLLKIKQSLLTQNNHANAYFMYSLLLYELNNKKLSKLFQQKAIEMNPLCQIYELPDKKAILKVKTIVESSIKHQQQIIKNNQKLVTNNWYHYTVMLHQQTDYQRVQQVYQRLFRKFPELYTSKSHAFLGNYANALYDLGKYQVALQKYEIQIQHDPTQMRYFSNCAMLYTIIGNFQKAEDYIKIALNGIPGRTSFLFNYANILSKTCRLNESIEKIKQVIDKQILDPIFKIKLAITLILAQKNQQISVATSNLNKAISIFKDTIQNNNIQTTNCNKRILSMKNVLCIKIFAELLVQLLKLRVQKWESMKQFLNVFSDYLIVGQSTKLSLNIKILMMLRQTLKSQNIDQKQISSLVQQQKQSNKKLVQSENQIVNQYLPSQIQNQNKDLNSNLPNAEAQAIQIPKIVSLKQILIESQKKLRAICYRSQIVRLTKWPIQQDLFGLFD